MVNIILERKQPVLSSCLFGDTLIICEDNHFTFACPCRTTPNPAKDWREKYGVLAPGKFTGELIEFGKKQGDVLVYKEKISYLNLPSAKPNPNHNGKAIISEVFIHKAYTEKNPGSAGCITLQDDYWRAFKKYIKKTSGEFNIILRSWINEL